MKNNINPIYKKMLRAYIEYLRSGSNGYLLISRASDDNKTNYNKSTSKMLQESESKYLRNFMEWLEIGTKDLEFKEDGFLRWYVEELGI